MQAIQGATASPNIPQPPLLKHMWPRVELLFVDHHPPWQWNFAIDKVEPSALAAQDLAMIRHIFNSMPKDVATETGQENYWLSLSLKV